MFAVEPVILDEILLNNGGHEEYCQKKGYQVSNVVATEQKNQDKM